LCCVLDADRLRYGTHRLHAHRGFQLHRSHDHMGFRGSRDRAQPPRGWGYQSFWLVGPDAPSILDAPGWVKLMPNAHNGYYDAMLELGYVGLALLVTFLVTTVHVI